MKFLSLCLTFLSETRALRYREIVSVNTQTTERTIRRAARDLTGTAGPGITFCKVCLRRFFLSEWLHALAQKVDFNAVLSHSAFKTSLIVGIVQLTVKIT